MLRQVFLPGQRPAIAFVRSLPTRLNRTYATSSEKRALGKQPTDGENVSASPPPVREAKDNGGNAGFVAATVAVALGGGGLAYYNGWLFEEKKKVVEEVVEKVGKVEDKNEEKAEPVEKVEKGEEKSEEKFEPTEKAVEENLVDFVPDNLKIVEKEVVETPYDEKKEVVDTPSDDKKEVVDTPSDDKKEEEKKRDGVKEAEVEESVVPVQVMSEKKSDDGNVVQKIIGGDLKKMDATPGEDISEKEVSKEQTPKEEQKVVSPSPFLANGPAQALAAQLELQGAPPDTLSSPASSPLNDALLLLHSELESTHLSDLDSLSPTQLKIRLVRLVSKTAESARYDALRTQELLRVNEAELNLKHDQQLHEQRIQYQSLLTEKLMEQQLALAAQLSAQHREKEEELRKMYEADSKAKKEEHGLDLTSQKERMGRALEAKHASKFQNLLADAKANFSKDLEKQSDAVQKLRQGLQDLEKHLHGSKLYETESTRAHRISAATAALCQKLEQGQPAATELEMLKASVVEGVLTKALERLPDAVGRDRTIPTVLQLQDHFLDTVYQSARQAALVPFNRTDIASQIYASLFATLTIPPDPSAGVSEEPNPDMVLSLVRDHVKKGNIENALTTLSQNQMDNNQLAFTIGDWQRGANDRVAVEKVLRVIKMECALLNAELAGKGTHAEQ